MFEWKSEHLLKTGQNKKGDFVTEKKYKKKEKQHKKKRNFTNLNWIVEHMIGVFISPERQINSFVTVSFNPHFFSWLSTDDHTITNINLNAQTAGRCSSSAAVTGVQRSYVFNVDCSAFSVSGSYALIMSVGWWELWWSRWRHVKCDGSALWRSLETLSWTFYTYTMYSRIS